MAFARDRLPTWAPAAGELSAVRYRRACAGPDSAPGDAADDRSSHEHRPRPQAAGGHHRPGVGDPAPQIVAAAEPRYRVNDRPAIAHSGREAEPLPRAG